MKPFVFEPFDLPVFDVPQKEHWPTTFTWEQFTLEFDSMRKQYMADFDSREKRLHDKNPEPFRV